MKTKKGVVNIHGREYKTVVLRLNEFRAECPAKDGWTIDTTILGIDEKWAIVGCKIAAPNGKIVGSGHGVEFWSSSNINKTSALENAETSAIGRALASIGLGGEEYASAEEVLNAIRTQEEMAEVVAAPVSEEPREVPENIGELVKQNISALSAALGEQDYRTWHSRVLKNFYSAGTINDLTPEQMVDFADKQQQRIAALKD